MSDLVTITKKQYESLLQDRKWRTCVEAAGVDNWQGYDLAMTYLYGSEDEDESE